MANKVLILFILAAAFSFIYCSSSSRNQSVDCEVLNKSAQNKPAWAKQTIFEDEKNIYFTEYTQVENNELNGLRMARSKLVKVIQIKIREYLVDYLLVQIKKSEMKKVIDDYYSELIEIMGTEDTIPDATYYEKIREPEREYFNCYVHKIISFKTLENKVIKTLPILKEKHKNNKSFLEILSKIK